MAKKKKKKSQKKRNLKYGHAPGVIQNAASGSTDKPKQKKAVLIDEESIDPEFKKELRKSLIFVGVFFIFIMALYFVLIKTDFLDPILSAIGLGDLYK
jgi:Trk-type K+ transport system membrane component